MALTDELKKQADREQQERNRAYLDCVFPQVFGLLNKELGGVSRNQATEAAILECCDGDPLKVSLDHVKLLLDDRSKQGLRAKLGYASESVVDQKLALMETILDLLEESRWDAASLSSERNRMLYGSDWDIPKLHRRKAEIEAGLEARGKSRQQLREEVRAQRPVYQQFEPLPEFYTPPGKPDCPVPWSKQLLAKLGATGTGPNNVLRRLLRRYGADALNEAIRLTDLRKGALR